MPIGGRSDSPPDQLRTESVVPLFPSCCRRFDQAFPIAELATSVGVEGSITSSGKTRMEFSTNFRIKRDGLRPVVRTTAETLRLIDEELPVELWAKVGDGMKG